MRPADFADRLVLYVDIRRLRELMVDRDARVIRCGIVNRCAVFAVPRIAW